MPTFRTHASIGRIPAPSLCSKKLLWKHITTFGVVLRWTIDKRRELFHGTVHHVVQRFLHVLELSIFLHLRVNDGVVPRACEEAFDTAGLLWWPTFRSHQSSFLRLMFGWSSFGRNRASQRRKKMSIFFCKPNPSLATWSTYNAESALTIANPSVHGQTPRNQREH